MRAFKEVLLLGKNKMLCCLVFLRNSTITLLLLFIESSGFFTLDCTPLCTVFYT